MSVKFLQGDLFTDRKAIALAHGVNCRGIMGAGIAVRFAQLYPAMFIEYRKLCASRPPKFLSGDIMFWQSNALPSVYNLATQYDLGPHAKYDLVQSCLNLMRSHANVIGIDYIAMPYIGCGIGGLEKDKVSKIVQKVFGDWPGTLAVYEFYGKK